MNRSAIFSKKIFKYFGSAVFILIFFTLHTNISSFDKNETVSFVDLKNFVGDAICEIRYATPYNFTGKVVPGYGGNVARITKDAAIAMKEAREILRYVECVHLALNDKNNEEKIINISADIAKEVKNRSLDSDLNKNDIINLIKEKLYKETGNLLDFKSIDESYNIYTFKIFDAYRPVKAVKHFMKWAKSTDTSMSRTFYPSKSKNQVIEEGYVAKRSGHSRGSTVDLTLFNLVTGKDLDMGGPFDYFGEISNYDKNGKNVSETQQYNRTILRLVMEKSGFIPLECEWWHFTLKNEPYPNTYFDF